MDDIQHICHGHLGGLLKRSQILKALDNYVKSLLPETLRVHCMVANIRDGILVMQVDSSVWANQLRFYQTNVLKNWCTEDSQTPCPQQIVIHIVSQHQAQTVNLPKPTLSDDNAALLEATAEGLADSHLGQALQRLARNHRLPKDDTD